MKRLKYYKYGRLATRFEGEQPARYASSNQYIQCAAAEVRDTTHGVKLNVDMTRGSYNNNIIK